MTDRFTLGVAMIVRNGGKLMKKSLPPFKNKVDEIAIVFGGVSDDNTEHIASRYATKTAHYDGELGENGELLDFAAARQQSFDLCGTDWVIAVDADDIWHDVGNIRDVIRRIPDKEHSPVVWVPYGLGNNFFHQPRIFRRDSGEWQGAIHEEFVFFEDQFEYSEGVAIKTGDVRIEQQSRPKEMTAERHKQNVDIAKKELEANPKDYRRAAQLCNDYLMTQDYEEAISATNHYLREWAADPEQSYNDELAYVWSKRGYAQLNTGDYGSAALSELWALGSLDRGSHWTYFAESVLRMGMKITERVEPTDMNMFDRGIALFDLAIMAADKALEGGKPRSGYADNINLTTYKPCTIKAMAYLAKREPRKALHSLDLGLAIAPDNEMMIDLRAKIASGINEVA